MSEVWKDIEGYVGLYQVSNLGNIRTVERTIRFGKHERLLTGKNRKLRPDKGGYLTVVLRNGEEKKNAKVHRLVAETFISNPNNLPQVNHKDENKSNNAVENLEWCDSKYNMNYGTARERTIKGTKKKILLLSDNGDIVKVFDSERDACKELNVCKATIYKWCNGKVKPKKLKETLRLVKENKV